MSDNYKKGDLLEIKVEKIVPRGFGLGFAENLTVLVPLAAPGDLVRVKIRDIKKRTAFAEIVDIVRPGPSRISPPCSLYGACGGCDLQHLSYTAQLEAKVGILRDSLSRLGKIEFAGEIPIIPSPADLGYRSRARWHIDRRSGSLGYLQRNSHTVIDVKHCPILTPVMRAAMDRVRTGLDADTAGGNRPEIEAVSNEDGRVSLWSDSSPEAAAEISMDVGGEIYAYSAETFFQANNLLTEQLVKTAIGNIAGETAFDLYCGVGLFTLPLARRFAKVFGIEEDRNAIEFAKRNAANVGLENTTFYSKSVEKFLTDNRKRGIDLVLLDPPRAGTEKFVIEHIADLRPGRISYVSCEPSILARDLRLLLDGGYGIESITALDMFPQTHHVETVVHLTAG